MECDRLAGALKGVFQQTDQDRVGSRRSFLLALEFDGKMGWLRDAAQGGDADTLGQVGVVGGSLFSELGNDAAHLLIEGPHQLFGSDAAGFLLPALGLAGLSRR